MPLGQGTAVLRLPNGSWEHEWHVPEKERKLGSEPSLQSQPCCSWPWSSGHLYHTRHWGECTRWGERALQQEQDQQVAPGAELSFCIELAHWTWSERGPLTFTT